MNLPRYKRLERKTPLKRSPVRKSRSKPRPGRLKGKAMKEQRQRVFERDNGLCVNCGRLLDPKADQIEDNSFHLAHKRNKRMWGDGDDNLQAECGGCHRAFHQNGPSRCKIVPAKSSLTRASALGARKAVA